MAGGTSGFQMVQSSKDNRSIKPNRKGMGENPYVRKGPGLEQRDPAHYPELLEERYRRKDAFRRVGLWMFLGILALMLGLMLWR